MGGHLNLLISYLIFPSVYQKGTDTGVPQYPMIWYSWFLLSMDHGYWDTN